MVKIQYPTPELIPAFRESLDLVARERVYIEMIEAPPLEKVVQVQCDLLARNGPVYYAVSDDSQVVGWCDIFPNKNLRQSHRGDLGMGLLPEFRGKGLGRKLLEATLAHAQRFGLEKVELHVYTSNTAAIALYRRLGFEEEGLVRSYRKLDGRTYDCLLMGKFLNA